MKSFLLAIMIISTICSCNNTSTVPNPPVQQPPVDTAHQQPAKQSFFPVTEYLKGELFQFRQDGITPIKYTTIKEHTDSFWVKEQQLNKEVREFLDPVIDSANLTPFFTEKQFMDRTLDAITFSYDPTGVLPDSIKINRWDVYVDPKTGKVKRVYMVKSKGDKTLQLTWLSGKYCKINTIINKPDGSFELEKEEKIVWVPDTE